MLFEGLAVGEHFFKSNSLPSTIEAQRNNNKLPNKFKLK
jgi:hypothetical protein